MKRSINKMMRIMIIVSLISILGFNLYFESVKLKAYDYNSACSFVYVTSVDNPISIEELVEEIDLKASLGEVDLSSSIINVNDSGYSNLVLNKPAAYLRTLGKYKLNFQVASYVGVSTTCEIIVEVVDSEGPNIVSEYSVLDYTFKKSDIENGKAYEIIKKSIFAVDNYSLFDVEVNVRELNFSETNEEGKNVCKVELVDAYGNLNVIDVTINVINDLGIYFTMDYPYVLINADDHTGIGEVIYRQNVKAFDSNGNELKVEAVGEYPDFLTELGVHTITLEAKDSLGNYSTIDLITYVVDFYSPTFSFDESKLIVYTNKLYSKSQFDNIIRFRIGNEKPYDYSIISDQYTQNYDKAGEYEVIVDVNYLNEEGVKTGETERLSLTMKVLDNNKKKSVKKKNFLSKMWNVIKKIGQIIYGIIKWPIKIVGSFF